MLARIQQFLTIVGLALCGAWAVAWWPRSPAIALAAFAVPPLGYAGALAAEFIAMHLVNRRDPAPRARLLQVVHAWWSEVLVGPSVFCWRQPFFPNAVPDRLPAGEAAKRRGVVFIHGFVCNRGFWTPWLRRMGTLPSHAERPFIAVNLEPLFGHIDDYVDVVEAAVARLEAATGLAPVLVCHSMGGLAARAWLRAQGRDRHGALRVAHVFTIGTPHGGTWLGQFSHARNGAQMRLASEWLLALGSAEATPGRGHFTCYYANCDNIVFPASTAQLAGADNRFVDGAAHVAMAFDPRVRDDVLQRIAAL